MPLPTPIRRLAALTARTAERAAGAPEHADPADGKDDGTGAPELAARRDGPELAARRDGPEPGARRDGPEPGARRDGPEPGHRPDDLAGDPADDTVEDAVEEAEALAARTGSLGHLGKPMDKRSPFFIGMTAAAGVAVTYAAAELLLRARGVLTLIGLALFLAAGLDRAVVWLVKHGWPRSVAVLAILLCSVGIVVGFIGSAIPPIATQATALAHELPQYMHQMQDHNTELGKLNAQYQIQQRLVSLVSSRGTTLAGGILGAGQVVLSTAESVLVVAVLIVYFLAAMPRIKTFIYRLWPRSRRERAVLIGEQIFIKVGGFMSGNVLTSLIAGVGTYIWMVAFGIPYPVLLALAVALLDLIPVVGSPTGGLAVTLVALTVSLPVAIGTLAFYVVYKLAEDYLLVPRVMGRALQVPGVVSLIAVLLGGTLLGMVGALVAIPAAAAIRLLLQEVTFRRLDSS